MKNMSSTSKAAAALGSVRSAAKTAAARQNGQLGGRPALIETDEGTHATPKSWYVFRRADGTTFARSRFAGANYSESEYTREEAAKLSAGRLHKV